MTADTAPASAFADLLAANEEYAADFQHGGFEVARHAHGQRIEFKAVILQALEKLA